MIDFENMLRELKSEAAKVAEEIDLSGKIEAGKDTAKDVRERIETDPKARMAAMGAGGLLLAGLLGTRGGRKLAGGAAKTGMVAALGALAYHAWQTREGAADTGTGEGEDAKLAGYGIDHAQEPQFAEALVRIMVAAAHADGDVDAAEQAAIGAALEGAGVDDEARAMLLAGEAEVDAFDSAVLAARSPNHAAQIYAAASAVAAGEGAAERAFLKRLADRLGLSERYAGSIDAAARG